MKVLMFGWELPPKNSGGLGVACFNLAKALGRSAKILFVLPKVLEVKKENFDILFANTNIKVKTVNSSLFSYATCRQYSKNILKINLNGFYGSTLFEEVARYGKLAKKIAEEEKFDIIHAHDWLSFLAGIEAKRISKKPLVVHVHATEFDRTGGQGVNPVVYQIEKRGMEEADKVIAVSNLTKKIIVEKYNIDENKVKVVYNAHEEKEIKKHKKLLKDVFLKPIVIFVGRITIQKGPDYFLEAAKKCLEYDKNIMFVMAGSGDMQNQIMQKAAFLGIADNFLFSGFLRGEDLERLYQSADLFVMPSLSEPFGLTVLEAIQNGTPVLISKQTGVGENLVHCLKTDFWDTEDMAAKILSVIKYKELRNCLLENSKKDLKKFSWLKAAGQCLDIYKKLLQK